MNAYERYRKKVLVQMNIKLNRNTDYDILKWLDTVPNIAGAVKAAIREHIMNECIHTLQKEPTPDKKT